MYSASAFARYVFPTPVGPRKRNVPMGFPGSRRPIRLRVMARTSFSMAGSWAMTFFCRSSFSPFKRMLSVALTRCTGTPLIKLTVSSTSARLTCSLFFFNSSSHCWRIRFSSCSFLTSSSRKLAADSKSCFCTADIFSSRRWFSSASMSVSSCGISTSVRCTREPASSMASMALSGRCRLLM